MERYRINLDAQKAQRQAVNRNYYQRQRANDQVVNAYCDYLGDRVLYENPDTGERVKVQDGGTPRLPGSRRQRVDHRRAA